MPIMGNFDHLGVIKEQLGLIRSRLQMIKTISGNLC